MKVRAATVDDMSQVLRLYAQPSFDDGSVLDEASARELLEKFADYPDYGLYVVEIDQAIIGSFALLVMINLGHMGAPSAIVEDVVVDPLQQGKGIGKTMMQAAMNLARDKGCYKLVLSSNARRHSAHAFYESLGFLRHGVSFHIDLKPPA